MSSWIEETEPMVYSGRIKVPYNWWVGDTGTRFFLSLRDERKILGTRCPKCDKVFVPPRKSCGRCFCPEMEWREVGPGGELVTYTVPRYREPIHPAESPFAHAIVKLDGADTGLVHIVAEFGTRQLKSGMRVEAVFREERQGNILDIHHFKPVE